MNDKKEYLTLVEELNKLSTNFEKNKDRMVEIAKILLAEHFNYKPKKKSEGDVGNAEEI